MQARNISNNNVSGNQRVGYNSNNIQNNYQNVPVYTTYTNDNHLVVDNNTKINNINANSDMPPPHSVQISGNNNGNMENVEYNFSG